MCLWWDIWGIKKLKIFQSNHDSSLVKATGSVGTLQLPFEMELSLLSLVQDKSKTHQTGDITHSTCKSITHLFWFIDLHRTANFVGSLSILLVKNYKYWNLYAFGHERETENFSWPFYSYGWSYPKNFNLFFLIADSKPSQSESAPSSNKPKPPFEGCNK